MVFIPPPVSARQLQGIDFTTATDFAAAAKHRFDSKDNEAGNRDPSLCKALLKFPGTDGAVFWSSKMGIDADGPSAGPGRFSGSQLDPGNGPDQDRTSYKPYDTLGLPAEKIPYIVLPKLVADRNSSATFDPAVAIGDVAIVIFKDKITAAVCGDLGPFNKIGEASIAVHEALFDRVDCPDPCTRRTSQGYCEKVRKSSRVGEDALYFVFPNSTFAAGQLNYGTINTLVKQRAYARYNELRGVGSVA